MQWKREWMWLGLGFSWSLLCCRRLREGLLGVGLSERERERETEVSTVEIRCVLAAAAAAAASIVVLIAVHVRGVELAMPSLPSLCIGSRLPHEISVTPCFFPLSSGVPELESSREHLLLGLWDGGTHECVDVLLIITG